MVARGSIHCRDRLINNLHFNEDLIAERKVGNSEVRLKYWTCVTNQIPKNTVERTSHVYAAIPLYVAMQTNGSHPLM